MLRYFLKRILQLIPVLIGVSVLVYFILDLAPGDVVDVIAPDDATVEDKERIREEMGLNRSIFIRYGEYMLQLLQGDLGISYVTNQSVWKSFAEKAPNTLKLGVFSTFLSVALSLPLGIYSAQHRGSWKDSLAMIFALCGLSMPIFWLGMLLILVFALKLGVLPSGGADGFASYILPGLALGISHMGILTRTTRSSMLDVIRQDYLRTARAKGVPEKQVINKHALRNALIPIITVVGAQYASSLGGATLTENVFSWPGLGRLLIDSLNSRDTQVVTGVVIMKTILISVILLLVDLLYAFVDPRIKSQYSRGGKKKRG